MTSSSALLRRVELLRRKMNPVPEPRHYSMILEEGEDIAEELRAQLHEHDSVVIRYYPKGMLGKHLHPPTHGQHMSCWLRGPRGRMVPHVVRQYGVDIGNV